jgi:isopenicillin-N N-acyltransferase like protein
MRRIARYFVPLILLVLARSLPGAEPRAFREGRFEQGELKYIHDVPVLLVQGTPKEIGRQKAALTGDVVKTAAGYPRMLLKMLHAEGAWQKCAASGTALMEHAPRDCRDEMDAFCKAAKLDQETGVMINTFPDTYRGWLGCSSLMVLPEKSATREVLFGRNLDFYPVASLDKLGLVTVYRPKGKHAFATIGFPGLLGCLSGMNDAGLAVAVHEVFLSHDGASMLNTKAMPYAICFRRILEECDSVATAEKLLRSGERSTLLNLAICDRRDCGVLEMTPKSVILRRHENGICACANDFRSKELTTLALSARYNQLSHAGRIDKIGLEDVAKALDAVNQGGRTMQTMIFEPGPLVLHVSLGPPPASKRVLHDVPLAPLFAGK